MIDQEDNEVDPSIYGNFAAMNELAAKSSNANSRKEKRKSPTKARKPSRGNTAAAIPNMEDLLNQMNTPEMIKMMKQFSEVGSGNDNMLSELVNGLLNESKLTEMFEELKESNGGHLELSSLVDMGLKMMKTALEENEDIKQLLDGDSEALKTAMLPFVEMMGGDVDKLDEMLKDKDNIKSTMMEGVEVVWTRRHSLCLLYTSSPASRTPSFSSSSSHFVFRALFIFTLFAIVV